MLLLLGFALVLILVFFLADADFSALGYAGLLCGALVLLAAAVDFGRYARTHRRLAALKQAGLESLSALPPARSLPERDYQALLEAARADRQRLLRQLQQREKDAMDYYTLWAHQIKSPIAAMRLLLQSSEPEAAALEPELFKVERYVEMVLSYQQLGDFGDLVIRPCGLEDMARQAVRKYAAQFVQKKLALEFGPLSGEVLTDEKWFCFVLEQLLSNAVKYTPAGTIGIYQPAPGLLAVEDTGIGIAPEDLPRVCEKSFTGVNGRLDKRATGIGLYLCKEICNRLGHGLRVEAEPGAGTRVTISLDAAALDVE